MIPRDTTSPPPNPFLHLHFTILLSLIPFYICFRIGVLVGILWRTQNQGCGGAGVAKGHHHHHHHPPTERENLWSGGSHFQWLEAIRKELSSRAVSQLLGQVCILPSESSATSQIHRRQQCGLVPVVDTSPTQRRKTLISLVTSYPQVPAHLSGSIPADAVAASSLAPRQGPERSGPPSFLAVVRGSDIAVLACYASP